MKPYWDSAALVQTTIDRALNTRLATYGEYARTHVIAEAFSALSEKISFRLSAHDAAAAVRGMSEHLEFMDLTKEEMLRALANAKGVRGGRIHDYFHALAAKKAGATALLTMDKNDFAGLVPGLNIEQV